MNVPTSNGIEVNQGNALSTPPLTQGDENEEDAIPGEVWVNESGCGPPI